MSIEVITVPQLDDSVQHYYLWIDSDLSVGGGRRQVSKSLFLRRSEKGGGKEMRKKGKKGKKEEKKLASEVSLQRDKKSKLCWYGTIEGSSAVVLY